MKVILKCYLITITQVLSCTVLLAQDSFDLADNNSQNIANSELKQIVLTRSRDDVEASQVAKPVKPALDRYIDIYINENESIRAKNAKTLLVKRLESQEEDLLYPSMYKALGYKNWNQVVSMPPELSSRRFSKQHESLNVNLLARLHETWALLDSTLYRMEYDQDLWVEPLIQRNLALSAIHSWYQGSFNEEYIDVLDSLNVDSGNTLESIAKTRSNLEKKTWRDAQIKLLKLKSDVAELTQFYLLGVSDVFLNTSLPALPKDEVVQRLNHATKASCLSPTQTMREGIDLLFRRFPEEMKLIKSSPFDDVSSAWLIGEIAHNLSKMALIFPDKEQAKYAIYALTDIVLERMLKLQQARLNRFWYETNTFFQEEGSVFRFRGINELQASLHEIFELTLLDYFLAGERATFANLMMHRKCDLDKANMNSSAFFTTMLNIQYTSNLNVDYFFTFQKQRIKQHALLGSVEHKKNALMKKSVYQKETNSLHKDTSAHKNTIALNSIDGALQGVDAQAALQEPHIKAKEEIPPSHTKAAVENLTIKEKNIDDIDNIRNADFLTAASIMKKRNIQVLSEEGVKQVFKGKGYTMQVVSTTSPNDVEYVVKRYKKRHDDVFVYLSKVTVEGERISIFKILVGSHKAEEVSKAEYLQLLDTAKKRKAFLKPYSFVRADVAKTS